MKRHLDSSKKFSILADLYDNIDTDGFYIRCSLYGKNSLGEEFTIRVNYSSEYFKETSLEELVKEYTTMKTNLGIVIKKRVYE